jgi:lambda family phage portal protein
MLRGVRNWLARQIAPPTASERVALRYDAARPSGVDQRHFAQADGLSANAANSKAVRAKLVQRSRYERDNNAYVDGLTQTLAVDLVGTGPRLELTIPGDEGGVAAKAIEAEFLRWAKAIDLAEDLRVLCEAQITDGESFAILRTNPEVDHPVTLDLGLYECEQISTPDLYQPTGRAVDGIRFDAFGNPTEYHLLHSHPGDVSWAKSPWTYDTIPASQVLHWFRPRRPQQARGIPTFTSSLLLGASLRRYTTATVIAAETAANLAGVLTNTTGGLNDPNGTQPSPSGDDVELVPGTLLGLPMGWDAKQFKPEQPTVTYGEFKHELLNEMGRPGQAPFNVVAGNSSGYNYSSGRLDHVPYHRAIWVNRDRLSQRVLNRLFAAWYAEARLIPGLIPAVVAELRLWGLEWNWDAFDSIDPIKDVDAAAARMANGFSTLAEECAALGKQWRTVLEQRAKEIAEAKRLGVPLGAPAMKPPSPQPPPDEEPPA